MRYCGAGQAGCRPGARPRPRYSQGRAATRRWALRYGRLAATTRRWARGRLSEGACWASRRWRRGAGRRREQTSGCVRGAAERRRAQGPQQGVRRIRGRRGVRRGERHCSCDTAGLGCDTAGPGATTQPLCAHLGVPGCPVWPIGCLCT